MRITLYVGPGIWQEGLEAMREAFSGPGFQVADTRGADFRLGTADVLVVGGGWAPDQRTGFGSAGLSRVREFVAAGGGYVGICAGAYLASARVRWESQVYEYPLGLFAGTADGPRPGLPTWPSAGSVEVRRVAGPHPLQGTGLFLAHYFGGSAFDSEGGAASVLLRYPDGSAAALALQLGLGRVALTGVHLEAPRSAQPRDAEGTRAFLLAMTRWAAAR